MILEQYAHINEFLAIAIMGICILALLGTAQVLHLIWKVPAEHTRKFLHISVSLLCVFTPFQFTNHWIVLGSTVFFTSLLWYSREKQMLSAIKHQSTISQGDIIFPVAIYVNYLFYYIHDFQPLFLLPLLILAIGDPAAFYGGRYFGKKDKSRPGLLAFILSSMIFGSFFLLLIDSSLNLHSITILLLSAVVGGAVEFYTRKGWDNLSIPLSLCIMISIYVAIWNP